jgi:hypothetical protein
LTIPRDDSFIEAERIPEDVVRPKFKWLSWRLISNSMGTETLIRTCAGSICAKELGVIDDKLRAVDNGIDAHPPLKTIIVARIILTTTRIPAPSS